jgi:hypothetical protein
MIGKNVSAFRITIEPKRIPQNNGVSVRIVPDVCGTAFLRNRDSPTSNIAMMDA